MDKVRIGVFGAWRGNSYISLMREEPKIEIVAICDRKATDKDKTKDEFGTEYFTDFDEFLDYGAKNGMNAVFLANFFNQHAPYAIKCMEKGMNVVSECTAASTLKECVELVEAVEKTGCRYMLAENYPFMSFNLEMERIIGQGKLGSLLYAEGEYNHTGSPDELRHLTPGPYHWRAWMPRTYYVTHALGPIMYMTKSQPRYVSARSVHSDFLYPLKEWRHNYDGAAMMFCEMDNGMMARFTGCTAMASDYSRYRVCGDIAGVEGGGYVGPDKVRMFYHGCTKPEDAESNVINIDADFSKFGELGERAKKAGHGGGDFWIVQQMIDYFLDGKPFYFDVYKAVSMSATAIIGWRSALEHGRNYLVPDFRIPEERNLVRWDDLTPFPDENGNGITLPCALPYEENK